MIFNTKILIALSIIVANQHDPGTENSLKEDFAVQEARIEEDFFVFFQMFCSNEDFQKSRILFPLKRIGLSDDLNSEVETSIKEEDWVFTRIKAFESNTFEYYSTSFADIEIPDSDEMVYIIGGIENGTNIQYYFRRIDGKWLLIKIINRST